ncbi:hypothetical protein BF93_17500 [Brachybacterium phenoliresistens]|uniref:Uncharacterized protein n=1 Tax=Brachybacterium phenoliresistens TaxID=396014 RepID=Z9JU99_9MICO|nr:DUF262 domain-containing protein [Brachybacterium phenoliresistens]EWS81347.1 hypothetical protein BF93_17500 [Brachybacterium phenoliresistens]
MTILADALGFLTVDDLFGTRAQPLRIPDFQRPYSWTSSNAADLVNDLMHAHRELPEGHSPDEHSEHPYIMGTVILLRRDGYGHDDVVDGQQRLITLHLLRTLLRGGEIPVLRSGETALHGVYRELERLTQQFEDQLKRDCFRDFVEHGATVLRIVTDDEDEAFQFFDSQNFRGKALRPHDLLKAYHLREMSGSSAAEQRAVVEQWEAADENELDQLFSTYLARIHWWSRNLSAHAFTAEDIGLFKGVSRSTRRLPGAEYHRAAKAILPGLQQWSHLDAAPDQARDLKRARHQLDTPVAAGRPFFDFAAFMLEESRRLSTLLYRRDLPSAEQDPTLENLRDGRRYRFSRELFLAAALYYTNKYGEQNFPLVRQQLFRWAYTPRLSYDRLTWRSTDNYALGRAPDLDGLVHVNLFAAMRDALDPSGLRLTDLEVPLSTRNDHEDDVTLRRLLNEGI